MVRFNKQFTFTRDNNKIKCEVFAVWYMTTKQRIDSKPRNSLSIIRHIIHIYCIILSKINIQDTYVHTHIRQYEHEIVPEEVITDINPTKFSGFGLCEECNQTKPNELM